MYRNKYLFTLGHFTNSKHNNLKLLLQRTFFDYLGSFFCQFCKMLHFKISQLVSYSHVQHFFFKYCRIFSHLDCYIAELSIVKNCVVILNHFAKSWQLSKNRKNKPQGYLKWKEKKS